MSARGTAAVGIADGLPGRDSRREHAVYVLRQHIWVRCKRHRLDTRVLLSGPRNVAALSELLPSLVSPHVAGMRSMLVLLESRQYCSKACVAARAKVSAKLVLQVVKKATAVRLEKPLASTGCWRCCTMLASPLFCHAAAALALIAMGRYLYVAPGCATSVMFRDHGRSIAKVLYGSFIPFNTLSMANRWPACCLPRPCRAGLFVPRRSRPDARRRI